VDAHGRVWSFAKDTIANAEHFVVSNAFKTTAKKTREVAITPEQSKSLSKVGVRGLNLLSDKLGLPSTSEVVLATNITTFINQLVPLVAVVPGAPAQGNGAAAGESNDDLMSLTVPELQVIAKDLNLRVGSKPKAQLLNEIRQARAVKGNEIEAAKTELESGRRRGSRALHDKYVNVFNSVDHHDRRWCDLQNHHDIQNWRAKFALSLLTLGLSMPGSCTPTLNLVEPSTSLCCWEMFWCGSRRHESTQYSL